MDFRNVLVRFLEELKRNKSPVISFLNDGIAEQEALALFSRINISPPKCLLDLYTWKNGLYSENINANYLLFGARGIFSPLEISTHLYVLDIEEEIYPKYLFPLFFDSTYLINIDPLSKSFNMIYYYSPSLGMSHPITIYDSLSKMFHTYIECFQKKAFFYDENKYFTEIIDDVEIISKSLNPKSEYWKQ
ncbi:hypothetical protein [Hymenobacter guriensis]|uniref:SMI1/KNR4 family protein n=1 Tax=Hymenobacter guriensis TaxID=2793065 RepID=A0ABS0L7R4_9BACT|nr:hypothetical protein [Hymenobacter guriensis]MBG8556147.1 hypothetical protein [Hymenobacter guriensis]